MNILTLAAMIAVSGVPKNYHIDCSGWNGLGHTVFSVRITAMDGSIYNSAVELFPGATVINTRDLIWINLKEAGGKGYTVGKGIIVLEEYNKSRIRSVEFTSKTWKPVARVVLAVSPKK